MTAISLGEKNFARVSWFIQYGSKLYPLKYTYALAIDKPPRTFTTNQMKAAMKQLGLSYLSLNFEEDEKERFYEAVKLSLKDPKRRLERLSTAQRKPAIYYCLRPVFRRNPDVVATALEHANGYCACCGNQVPFVKMLDATPYLEVHHKIFLSQGGGDTVENAEALWLNGVIAILTR